MSHEFDPSRRTSPGFALTMKIGKIAKLYYNLIRSSLDSRASTELSQLNVGFIPWSASAFQPAALMSVLNEISINNRKTVVEFGCGISTVYIAKILSASGGHLVSVEHDPEWIDIVSRHLVAHELDRFVTLVFAPLQPCPLSLNGLAWYDLGRVSAALVGRQVDLVVVDGPPAYERGQGLARYPALPALRTYLGDTCAIVVDDIDRHGERQMLRLWKKTMPYDFKETIIYPINIAVLYRGQHLNSRYV